MAPLRNVSKDAEERPHCIDHVLELAAGRVKK
jgi:hypothetical protein